ncbi:MAG TPA: alanine racemase [Mycobacteriales bacterium]|nr:alanine racemase [Mycobacteriales bacterium]
MDRCACRVDLDAIRANVGELRRRASSAAVMAVVKADGYGHGLVPAARAAVAGGASWLGVALVDEALALRAAGLRVPILAWLIGPGADVAAAARGGVDVGVSSRRGLAEAVAAAALVETPVRVQLKVDTGLGRGGAPAADWADLVEAAAKAESDGLVAVSGVWSHLAQADVPDHPSVTAQLAEFRRALDVAAGAGLDPQVRHLANSAATLTRPDLHFDLVRPGIAVYGVSPGPLVGSSAELGLRPAMTLTARVAHTKRVPAGHGVSYGHRYRTARASTLALVPVGYGDGIPRSATNAAEVWLGGARRRISGTVCMDQFVVDMGDDPVADGDEVVLFGPGDAGEPTAHEWGLACGTIGYEIVTRIGPRVPRVYVGTSP